MIEKALSDLPKKQLISVEGMELRRLAEPASRKGSRHPGGH